MKKDHQNWSHSQTVWFAFIEMIPFIGLIWICENNWNWFPSLPNKTKYKKNSYQSVYIFWLDLLEIFTFVSQTNIQKTHSSYVYAFNVDIRSVIFYKRTCICSWCATYGDFHSILCSFYGVFLLFFGNSIAFLSCSLRLQESRRTNQGAELETLYICELTTNANKRLYTHILTSRSLFFLSLRISLHIWALFGLMAFPIERRKRDKAAHNWVNKC